MALFRSRSTDYLPYKTATSTTRQLQEALYTLLDDLEKSAFIEALSEYRAHTDIVELVNSLRKILNTPVKRQLFPLVRQVIRRQDVEAFDLVTRGVGQSSSLTLPCLYSPHMADLNVLNKYQASTALANHRATLTRSWAETTTVNHDKISGRGFNPVGAVTRVGGVSKQDVKHKTLSKRMSGSRHGLDGEILEIDIGEPEPSRQGFGFSIRGGLETGVGVHVSSVTKDSLARRKGLMVGDHILEANNISFSNISHEEAARIITAASRLRLTVSRAGRIPGSHIVHESYSWTDPRGRPVSPPAEWVGGALGEDDGRTRSGTLMLKGSDERKINLVVHKGQGLGVMIRGGSEYGLGIFVSGVDPFSVADNGGLKLGDQILDVNGRSFLDVTHTEAVNHLKISRHLIMTVKDVGKVPVAKTTIDERGWIESTKVGSYPNSLSLSSWKSVAGSATDQEVKKKRFLRGAGTQLMLSTSLGKAKQREQIHDQAKLLLNEKEHATLNYYLAEYEKKVINIRGLVHALLELFNTPAKFTMLSEIRATVLPADLDTFDKLVVRRDLEESLTQARQLLAPDGMSLNSFDSDDVIDMEKHKRTMFSHVKSVARNPQRMDELKLEEDAEDHMTPYRLLETSRRLSRSTPDLSNHDDVRRFKRQIRSRSRSPRSAYRLVPAMDAFRTDQRSRVMTFDREFIRGKRDDPSDDSGVEVNGHAQKWATVGASHIRQGQAAFVFTAERPRVTQDTSSRALSDPQKKILTHLQHRNNTAGGFTDVNSGSQNVSSYKKQKSVRIYDELPLSKSSLNENKGSYSFAAPPHSEKDAVIDSIDVLTPGQELDNPSNSPRGTHSQSNSQSLRLTARDNQAFTTGSKSKSENINECHNVSASQENYTDTRHSQSCKVQESHTFSHKNVETSQNQEITDIAYEQTQFDVQMPHPQSSSRKEKSPFKRIWNNMRHGYDGASSSQANSLSKPHGTLTINGQDIPSTQTNGQDIHSNTVPLHASSAQNYRQEQEHRKQDQSVFSEGHAHQLLTANNNKSDTIDDTNGTAPNPERANKQSKRVLFTNARTNPSSVTTPPKVGGVTSTRYKSPRRDKQVSKINVPLIRRDLDFLDDEEPLSLVSGRDREDFSDSKHYLAVNHSGDPFRYNENSLTRVTITDQRTSENHSVHNSPDTDDVSSGTLTGRNVTSISVSNVRSRQDHSDWPVSSQPTSTMTILKKATVNSRLTAAFRGKRPGDAMCHFFLCCMLAGLQQMFSCRGAGATCACICVITP